jgi:predicted RNA binding protein YcfA (HicA-like mRNA interferase family)
MKSPQPILNSPFDMPAEDRHIVGGHRQYKHLVKRGRVTVPGRLNADLDPRTEKSILKQAGLGL